MRQTYLRQGGSNPAILAQMAEMEAEAMNINNQEKRKEKQAMEQGKKNYCKFINVHGN